MTVLSIDASTVDNAGLIVAAAKLGYIGDNVLDLSYGHGGFWRVHAPARLVSNDLNPDKGDHTYDVTGAVPEHWSKTFGTVVWDPPYRMSGARDLGAFDERYGTDTPASPLEVLELIMAGVDFGHGCLAPGGTLLVKVQDQVVSGRKVWQTHMVARHAELQLKMRLVDQLHLVGTGRPQPAGRRQVHSRSNYSTLMVLR